jgi:hypothetical protein
MGAMANIHYRQFITRNCRNYSKDQTANICGNVTVTDENMGVIKELTVTLYYINCM